jgi:hypothetical protein
METVTLLDDDGELGRMLRAAAKAQTVFAGSTLVGGLAVVARCQHGRVTRDVDSVIETERSLGWSWHGSAHRSARTARWLTGAWWT